ncbi:MULTISPECIES: YlmC/YmxH family sporulation protein [Alteribacter]|uniref:YlmC/YmxH family sporulation protein n=1 Tax=Alteribacter keqinensis TaxID=2483800 RepID=A0A3M7TVM0_9BACI|nr:YlmC/YmxH family sporulation protein [Alteribacter keqinensis]MBM7095854.1 YlmC/YmxH family sporulation protein [Alteribacter salitolerans]RNA69678.1 YlmC/YmxH family sporulation protein [Alteribacter keqinensis]
MLKISDIQSKDIVNLADGRLLGHISDLDINLTTGRVEALIIGGGKVMNLFGGKDQEVVIPWNNVIKIGSDVILVRHNENGFMDGQYLPPSKGDTT